jgi:low temperature requirement protein LtrA
MNIGKISPPRLRTKEQEGKRAATWLELFYDLAFVVAVAVLSGRLLGDITWPGMASYFAYFALLWWLWASHTFYADRYDTDDLVYRLLASGQMVSVVIIAASLEGDSRSTLAFAVGYALARALLVVMYFRAYRHVPETRELVKGYVAGFGLATAVWVAAIFVPESVRFSLWAVALVIDLATPWVMRREQAKVPLDVSHLPERFGLFTILVLGESIAAIVTGLTHVSWAPTPTFAAALAIGTATGLWWLYFDNARGTVVRRVATVRRTWRPTGWIYTHLPLAAALAALAVAMERALEEAGHGGMAGPDRWLLVGTASVTLAAMALIQHTSSGQPDDLRSRGITLNRLLGIPFLLLLGLLSGPESQWLMVGVFGVVLAELVGDMTLNARFGDQEREETHGGD